MTLTIKQQLFVDEYLRDLNATQAAIRAGYSEKTAYSQGQRMLKNVETEKAIQGAMNKRSEKLQISAEYVLNKLKDITDSDEEKTADRLKGLELLGKHLKLFTDRLEHSGETGVKIINDIPRSTS